VVEFDPVEILRTLEDCGVRYVLIGGIAARLRGAPLLTEDLDITPDTAPDNLASLCRALVALEARLRTASDPNGVAFPIEPDMLAVTRIWTFTTRHGDLDLVFEPAGTRGYPDLARGATRLDVAEEPVLSVAVAELADIIRTKEAAGRAKDRAALPLLRATLEEVRRQRAG
jgi:hypothetical protein